LNNDLTTKCAKTLQWLVFCVWPINTHPSHARYLSWPFKYHTWHSWVLFLTQVLFDPLWVCEDLVFDLSDLSIVVLVILQASIIYFILGGCRLLDGSEEWKLWALQEDCEGGPMFCKRCCARFTGAVKSNSSGNEVQKVSRYWFILRSSYSLWVHAEEAHTW
jgi:hypothetical protein